MGSETATDTLFDEILAWGKAAAIKEHPEAPKLDLHHILIGAMKTTGGQELLAACLGEGPDNLDLEALPNPELAQVNEPVRDRKLDLAPRLKEITDMVWLAEGKLAGAHVLNRVVQAIDKDASLRPWLGGIPHRQHPRAGKKLRTVFERVTALREGLADEVVGQDAALRQICDGCFAALMREQDQGPAQVQRHDRGPRMLFTFVGPPGVGKTLSAETLAQCLGTDDEKAPLLRLDMSAYAAQQTYEQLVGVSLFYKESQAGILTGFVKQHPNAVVLVDEIEKAHRNSQHIFLQVLDAGHLYDNHLKEEVDFSGVTMIFTTNLGSEIYDSPNHTRLLANTHDLNDTVIEALRREGSLDTPGPQPPRGFSPELLSRLAKGHIILFQRLGGAAMERLAARTFRRVSEEIEEATGLALDYDDRLVLTLMALRFGLAGDARRLATGLRRYLYQTINTLLNDHRETLLDTAGTAPIDRFSGFVFRLAADTALPETVKRTLERPTSVCLVDDEEWPALPEGGRYRFQRARTWEEIDSILRGRDTDLVLLDLHIGCTDKTVDRMEEGLALLRQVRHHYPDIPVYLFSESPDQRGLSEELLQRVAQEGGARGILQKRFYSTAEEEATERDAFFRQLDEVDRDLRHHRIITSYQRRGKLVEFDIRCVPTAQDSFLPITIHRCRETPVLHAVVWEGPGMVDIPSDRLDDVVGAEHAKERLREVVGWLIDPLPVRKMGIDLPRGILLTGPPGTGKTSLARAVAGESGLPFFAVTGAEIFDKYVGESERRIRLLFQQAKRFAPAIIFFDEIDSIGAARDAGPSNRVDTAVLNELLAQLDGFAATDRPLFVLAATNRPDTLDPALLRPGRFDMQIEVPLPNPKAREALFRLYLQNLPTEDIAFDTLTLRSAGMSGAAIKQVCKEAGILALRQKAETITQRIIEEALTNIKLGLADPQLEISETCRRSTAAHEAGHALARHLRFPGRPLAQISILPRGRALGFVETFADHQHQNRTRQDLAYEIQVCLAGRAAEELLGGPESISDGCTSDLAQATRLAMGMITRLGMDEDGGLLHLPTVQESLGAQSGLEPFSEAVRQAQRILQEQYRDVKALLEEHRKALEKLARHILEKESLYGEEIQEFLREVITES